MKAMPLILTLIVGMVIGFWLAAQQRALNMPTIELPGKVSLDSEPAMFGILFVLILLWKANHNRRKRGGRRT